MIKTWNVNTSAHFFFLGSARSSYIFVLSLSSSCCTCSSMTWRNWSTDNLYSSFFSSSSMFALSSLISYTSCSIYSCLSSCSVFGGGGVYKCASLSGRRFKLNGLLDGGSGNSPGFALARLPPALGGFPAGFFPTATGALSCSLGCPSYCKLTSYIRSISCFVYTFITFTGLNK